MCAANRKIICLDTEYSTNWDSHIIYFYVYNFILESFMFIPFMFYVCCQ